MQYDKHIQILEGAKLHLVESPFNSGEDEWADDRVSYICGAVMRYVRRQSLFDGLGIAAYDVLTAITKIVGDTMVLNAFPGLYFIPPYQRCSLLDAKAKALLSKQKYFYVQTKCDGSFAYLTRRLNGSVDVITRQGNTYPQPIAEMLTEAVPTGFVMVAELLVYVNDVLLDRKTGNGILNSLQQGGELPEGHIVRVVAWDMLSEQEFIDGKSTREYEVRLHMLTHVVRCNDPSNIEVVETHKVTSLAEALKIYTEHTSQGKEGVICKLATSLWKNGTAKDIVKLKIRFEAEYRVTAVIEGEGKAKGMVGAISVTTSDDLLESNVGTGIDDKTRKAWFDDPSLILEHIVTLEANDVIQSRDTRKKPSLSLPVFVEIRTDKKVADTFQRVLDQLEAAKQGKEKLPDIA